MTEMPPIFKTVMICCMLGVLLMLIGAEGVPRNRGPKAPNRFPKNKQDEGPTSTEDDSHVTKVNLLLDPSNLSTAFPVQQVANYSLSPWTYSTSHDETRFPPDIAEARCILMGCQNAKGQEVMDVESRPILHQILVLRRVRDNGEIYSYRLESKTIAVGCTCVRPNLMHQK